MRHSTTFKVSDPGFKQRLLAWTATHKIFCILESNSTKQSFTDKFSAFDFIIAIDAIDEIEKQEPGDSFTSLKNFYESKNDWIFGFLTYDLKNETEDLPSERQDGNDFPAIHFFQPRLILKLNIENDNLEILYLEDVDDESTIQKVITEISGTEIMQQDEMEVHVQQTISKEEYISTVTHIKQHIQLGDIYEMNYCVDFFAEESVINPIETYCRLNEASPMPFSCFYRNAGHYLLCASPERFLEKEKIKLSLSR